MYSQSFSPLNLYSCTTQTERRNSGLDKDTLVHEIELCIGNSIDSGIYHLSSTYKCNFLGADNKQ